MQGKMLNETTINNLKEKAEKIEFCVDEYSLTLAKLFLNANRNPFQTGLLFKYAYHAIKDIDMAEIEKVKQDCKRICEEEGLYKQINGYNQYKSCGCHIGYEARIGKIVDKNSGFINEIINVVFGKILLPEIKEKEPLWKKKIDVLKKDKTEVKDATK
jgi:hypothetical protein